MPADYFYRNAIGRMLLRPVVSRGFSKAAGAFLDTRFSKILIRPFVQVNKIDMTDCRETNYKSFNAFFTRALKPGARPVDMASEALIAPCDGLLTAVCVDAGARFLVKGIPYTLGCLLDDAALAQRFSGGTLLIFRLTPAHYHRYCFADDGRVIKSKKIRGIYHTVRPIALENVPVFRTNAREYALMETKHLGEIVQIEVGATLVGRISNHPYPAHFTRGAEKGMFEFGGSTILLLLQKGVFALSDAAKKSAGEFPVRMGQKIGTVYAFPSSV